MLSLYDALGKGRVLQEPSVKVAHRPSLKIALYESPDHVSISGKPSASSFRDYRLLLVNSLKNYTPESLTQSTEFF
jgi:hypothetical protein